MHSVHEPPLRSTLHALNTVPFCHGARRLLRRRYRAQGRRTWLHDVAQASWVISRLPAQQRLRCGGTERRHGSRPQEADHATGPYVIVAAGGSLHALWAYAEGLGRSKERQRFQRFQRLQRARDAVCYHCRRETSRRSSFLSQHSIPYVLCSSLVLKVWRLRCTAGVKSIPLRAGRSGGSSLNGNGDPDDNTPPQHTTSGGAFSYAVRTGPLV